MNTQKSNTHPKCIVENISGRRRAVRCEALVPLIAQGIENADEKWKKGTHFAGIIWDDKTTIDAPKDQSIQDSIDEHM